MAIGDNWREKREAKKQRKQAATRPPNARQNSPHALKAEAEAKARAEAAAKVQAEQAKRPPHAASQYNAKMEAEARAAGGRPAGEAPGVRESARQGAAAAANNSPKEPKTDPNWRQRTSAKLKETGAKINESNAAQRVKNATVKTGKGLYRGGKAVIGGTARGAVGLTRAAMNPWLLGAAAVQQGYATGKERMEARDEDWRQRAEQLGPLAPNLTAVQPSADEATLLEKAYVAAEPGVNYGMTLMGNLARARSIVMPGIPEKPMQPAPDRADRLAAEAEQAAQERWGAMRERTDTLPETMTASRDLETLRTKVMDSGYYDSLMDQNLAPQDRINMVKRIVSDAQAEGVPAQAVYSYLADNDVSPEILQGYAAQTNLEVPLVGYNPDGSVAGMYDEEGAVIEGRDAQLPASLSTGNVLQRNDQLNTFTDINTPWRTQRIGNSGPLVTRTEEERMGDTLRRNEIMANARPQLTDEGLRAQDYARFAANQTQMEATPGIRVLGGSRQRAAEYGNWLRDPESSPRLQQKFAMMQLERAQRAAGALPGMQGAKLSELPLGQRLEAIMNMRTQAKQRVEQEMNTPGMRRRIEQLADPTGALRRNAKNFSERAGDYQDALQNARDTMRAQLENQYMPDIPKGLEDSTLEQEARAVSTQQEGWVSDFQDAIKNRAGDNAAASRSVMAMARTTGLEDQVRAGKITPQQAEMEIQRLYGLDQLFKKFGQHTGKTVGFDVAKAYREGGPAALSQAFAAHFAKHGGDYSFDNPRFANILSGGADAGALWDRVKSVIPFVADDDIGTMVLRGPEGDSITVRELIGDDPFVYEAFIDMVRSAANAPADEE